MPLSPRRLSALFTTLAAAALSLSTGCSTMPETGPTVGIRNDSDAPLRATFWIGDRHEQRPGAHADMKAQDTLDIPPYGTKQFRLRAFSGYESPTDSFVRVQVEPVGPSFQPQTQYWYELNPPSPYTIRVHGLKPKLAFERLGGGSMVMVPSDLWFRNAGTTAAAVYLNTNNAATLRQPIPTNQPVSPAPAKAAPAQVTGVNDRP